MATVFVQRVSAEIDLSFSYAGGMRVVPYRKKKQLDDKRRR